MPFDCTKKWNFIFYSIFINSHCTIVNFAVVTSWGYCVTCILLSIKIRHERDLSKKGEQWMSVTDKYVYIDGKRIKKSSYKSWKCRLRLLPLSAITSSRTYLTFAGIKNYDMTEIYFHCQLKYIMLEAFITEKIFHEWFSGKIAFHSYHNFHYLFA